MKKTLKLLVLFLIGVVFAFGFASCSDGGSSSGGEIIEDKIILHAYEFTNVYVWDSDNIYGGSYFLDSEGDGWYEIELDTKYTKLYFSSNTIYDYPGDWNYSLERTEDLERSAGEWWFLKDYTVDDDGITKWRGKWYSYKPSVGGSSSGGNEGDNSGNESGSGNVSSGPWTSDIYLEIMMFSNVPTNFNDGTLVKFDSDSAEKFKEQLRLKYQMKDNTTTSLNLSFHSALVNLNNSEKNQNIYNLPADKSLQSVNIITFTDGVDNSSDGLSEHYKYDGMVFGAGTENYGEWLRKQIETRTVAGIGLDCYAVGVKGSDVDSVSDLKNGLENISNHEVFVEEFDTLADRFSNIVEGLTVVNNKYDFDLRVPLDAGAVKMVFDGKDEVYSQIYFVGEIEHIVGGDYTINVTEQQGVNLGVVNLKGDMEYDKETGAPTGQVIYKWKDIHFDSITDSSEIKEMLSKPKCRQFVMRRNESSFSDNTKEYDTENNHQATTEHFSTAIYLILDASRSLSTDIDKVRDAAIQFIDALSEKAKSATSVQ